MPEPIVKIKLGQLRGTVNEDVNGESYYSFKGIPYAKPPVGKLRFKVINKTNNLLFRNN